MTHNFSKRYITSTCNEISRKTARGEKLMAEGKQFSDHAAALRKMLVDAGVPEAEINLTIAQSETAEKLEAAKEPAAKPSTKQPEGTHVSDLKPHKAA